jgi:diaminopimelate epimerase
MHTAHMTWHYLHSQGNRFIVAIAATPPLDVTYLLKQFRHLHTAYPSDQWICLHPLAEDPFWEIQFWNCDGSRALACGNGTRCAAHLLYQFGLADAVLEMQGPVSILQAQVSSRTVEHAEVLVFQGEGRMRSLQSIQQTFSASAWRFLCEHASSVQAVEIGNLHLVLYGPEDPVHKIQTYHTLFGTDFLLQAPKVRTFSGNISYVRLNPPTQEADIMTWENGVGTTQACGSAACAALSALRSYDGRSALTLRFPGGIIQTYYDAGCWHSADSYYLSSISSKHFLDLSL